MLFQTVILLSLGTCMVLCTPEAGNASSTIICPDGRLECAGHATCCSMPGGYYGCCPFPNATCCADHLHCCPPGTTCDLVKGECRKSSNEREPVVWTDITRASIAPKNVAVSNKTKSDSEPFITNSLLEDKQVCPGGRKTCPESYTCCALPEEGYGCCPIRNAVCCSDHIHCCPEGSECDVAGGGCKKKSSKEIASSNLKNVVCPDGRSQCPDSTTCCLTPDGGYGCCPLQNAVCCDDKLHCCPQGYRCFSTGYCSKVSTPYDAIFFKDFSVKHLAKKVQ